MIKVASLFLLAFAVALQFLLPKWQGFFESNYVPEQKNLLPSLPKLIEDVKASGKPCNKPTRVVVTLSTFTGRLGRLKKTIESLAAQSCQPDAIYVFISKNPRTKSEMETRGLQKTDDGVADSEAFRKQIRSLSSNVIVQGIDNDWGPATKLLAALQVEKDPSTWLITVDDDTEYHRDTVLALVTAAAELPFNTAPGFWCEEAWADGYRSVKKRTMEKGEEGTVHGWCGGFAGVLFKRFMFQDHVFNFSTAPAGCLAHDDVWWGGHLLSAGNVPYLINPGFFSVDFSPTSDAERQLFSVNKLDAVAKKEGTDLQADCASWFAALRGSHLDGDAIPNDVFRHPEAEGQSGQDLWVFREFFSNEKGLLPPKGTFVEFGALDGTIHSNTNFFEKYLGWKGALAEPSEHFREQIRKNRPGSFALTGAVCGKSGLRSFVDTPWAGLSGFEDTYDPDFLARMKAGELWFNITSISPIQCYTLEELLDKAGLKHVNYMTVDTEGSEFETLNAFPFEKYQVDILQVESHLHNCVMRRGDRQLWFGKDPWHYWCRSREGADKLIQLMLSKGYDFTTHFVVDAGHSNRRGWHKSWLPFTYAEEMTVDLIFHRKK